MLFLVSLLGSCTSLFIDKQEFVAFKILNRINYPYQEVLNKDVTASLQDVLDEEEISTLENWRNTTPYLENFLETECAGCSNSLAAFKPIYRVKKGKVIHFGLQNEMGVENWVFNENGAFVIRFDMFQGESQEQIHKKIEDIQNIDYVLKGVYPTAIEQKSISLEHIEYQNSTVGRNQWYKHMFPTKIGYKIDLSEKKPTLRFKIDGGLYSYQKTNDNGEFQIINFVEPLIYPNAVDFNEPMSYSSFTHAFYANATFFLLNLEEAAQVSIHIESKTTGKEFKFSVLQIKGEGFYTINEYLQKEVPLFDKYHNTLNKGRYLIRVVHANADYTKKPLYTIHIDKENSN